MNKNAIVEPFECRWETFPNLGILIAKVPQKYLDILNSEIEHISNNRNKSTLGNEVLAGQLSEQYRLDVKIRNEIEPFIVKLSEIYENTFGKSYKDITNTQKKHYVLRNLWMNLQKKHEYNPLHDHSGAYSFALWMKIPYDVNTEKNLQNSVLSKNKENSSFNFVYTDILGNMRKYDMQVDNTKEGTLAFFPSQLNHYVNPFFTSDEERISVSGNLFLDYE